MVKKRLIYFDILKIICTLFVIYNHSWWYFEGHGKLFITFKFTVFCFSKMAVPIFLMITGALMLKKDTSYNKILKKRIPRIYIGMLSATIFGCIFFKLNYKTMLIRSIFGSQTSVNLYWLWYIYLLITLYLLTPFIKKITNNFNERDYKNFFIIFLILPSCVFYFSNFSELALGKYKLMENLFEQLLYLTYIGYYVFGYYISNKKISPKLNKRAIICNIVGYLLGMLYLTVGYKHTHEPVELFNNTIVTVLMSTSTFISFKYYYENLNVKPCVSKIILLLSESNFGIYLFHLYLVEYLIKTKFIIGLIKYNVFLGYFTMIFMTYFILATVFYFIRKIPIFKKIY